jgi:putative DNA primase/helicase
LLADANKADFSPRALETTLAGFYPRLAELNEASFVTAARALHTAGSGLTVAELRRAMKEQVQMSNETKAKWMGTTVGENDVKLVPEDFRQVGRARVGLGPVAIQPAREPLSAELWLTDVGNARRLWELAGQDIRWVRDMGAWAIYDGRRWVLQKDEPTHIAKQVSESLHHVLESIRKVGNVSTGTLTKEIADFAKRSASSSSISDMINLFKSEPGIAKNASDFDANVFLLNAENGAFDLRTGEAHPHRREDLCTKLAPRVDTTGTCPTWEAWLDDVFDGGESMRFFLQEALGYSITGCTEEQCLFFVPGPGSNGKSTLFRVLQAALGDYAGQTPRTLLMADERGGQRHPTELTTVKGVRFAYSSETPEEGHLDETKMKALTGGDPVTARYVNNNFFTFTPTHKFWLGTNHLPRIHGTEHAIWRRIRVLPMPNKYWREDDPQRPEDGLLIDVTMEPRLMAELPAILGWIVRGAAIWHSRRSQGLSTLQSPREVNAATRTYRLEQDRIEQWLDECCMVGDGYRDQSAKLYAAYAEWCQGIGERAEGFRVFGRRLTTAGFEHAKVSGGVHARTGLRIAVPQERNAGLTGRRHLKSV